MIDMLGFGPIHATKPLGLSSKASSHYLRPISRRKLTHHARPRTVPRLPAWFPLRIASPSRQPEQPPPMIRAAASVRELLPLPLSFVIRAKAAPTLPVVSRKNPLLGRGRSYYLMDTRGQDEITTLTTRGCHSSSENQELAKKSCVPCNSKDLHPMSEDSAKQLLEQVNGWELTTEGGILKLHRTWKVKNFVKGLEFFQLVAAVAEGEGHHPDLHLVGWNNVKIDVWTHSVRGLTENDFVLAAKINHLNLEGLLSKKKANFKE